MFAILTVSVLFACAGAQSCMRPQDLCLKVGASHLCPNGMGCIINKLDDDKSYCCALTDIVNTPPVQPATAAPVTCTDKINPATGYSDCPQRAYLCNDVNYRALMTDQCPRTCNRCTTNGNTGNTGGVGGGVVPGGNPTNPGGVGTCVDKLNPNTGVSDCPRSYMYCNNAAYIDLMRDQCPKTCGFC